MLDSGVPQCRLRKSVIGTLAIIVRHIKNAVTATEHKVFGSLNRNGDARSNVTIRSIVQARVVRGVEDNLTRNESTKLGADGVLRGETKIILRIVTFGWGGLDLIAQTQVESNPRGHPPAVLDVPTEEVFIGSWECLIGSTKLTRRAVASTSHSKEEGRESISRSRCRVIRIRPFRRRGLDVESCLAVVPAVNPQPHIRKTKSQLVPTL